MTDAKGRVYAVIPILLLIAWGSWWLWNTHQETIRKNAFLASIEPKHVYRLVLEIGLGGEDDKDDYWTVNVEDMYEVKPGCFAFLPKALRPKNMFNVEIHSMQPIDEFEFDPNDQKLLVEMAIRRLGNLVIARATDDPKKAALREIFRKALSAREVVLRDFDKELVPDKTYGEIYKLMEGPARPDQTVFDQALVASHG